MSLLAWWYEQPARGAAFVLEHAMRIALVVVRVLAALGGCIAIFASLVLLLMVLAGLAFVSIWLIVVSLTTPMRAWAKRMGEFSADQTAVRLGYGPQLVEVFQAFIARDAHGGRPEEVRDRLLSTHPSHTDRIKRVHALLR